MLMAKAATADISNASQMVLVQMGSNSSGERGSVRSIESMRL